MNEPTTTHSTWGAGNPRLLVSHADRRSTFTLTADSVTIGSASSNDLVLPGIDAVHARVDHDGRDEYVVTLIGSGEMNANPESAATHPGLNAETLRTGARFTAGAWTFVYMRDEFADHGRPYGGRQGGEFSDQQPQPPRPDYTGTGRPRGDSWEVQD